MLASPKGGIQFVVPDGDGTLAEVNFKMIMCVLCIFVSSVLETNSGRPFRTGQRIKLAIAACDAIPDE